MNKTKSTTTATNNLERILKGGKGHTSNELTQAQIESKLNLPTNVDARTLNYRCYHCNGSGKVWSEHGDLTHFNGVRYNECKTCGGGGNVDFTTSKNFKWLKNTGVINHNNTGVLSGSLMV